LKLDRDSLAADEKKKNLTVEKVGKKSKVGPPNLERSYRERKNLSARKNRGKRTTGRGFERRNSPKGNVEKRNPYRGGAHSWNQF